ncbi:MAG: hypothetical protein JSU82_02765 [Rhodospirillales bacterium]|nr:MAG: hypothetical protein JSU82_02765 [Rhodospirillales bacterium]
MSVHLYPTRDLSADYVRAAIGLSVTAGPALLLQPAPAVAAVLGGLAVLFAAFALRTGMRQLTAIEVTEDGIAAQGPLSRRISRDEVTRVRLDYFSFGRERAKGWMQLKISHGYRHIRVDSTIEDFETVAQAAAEIARRNELALSDTTVANFRAMGLAVDDPDREIAA